MPEEAPSVSGETIKFLWRMDSFSDKKKGAAPRVGGTPQG